MPYLKFQLALVGSAPAGDEVPREPGLGRAVPATTAPSRYLSTKRKT
jgi:hypothetical protein